MREVKITVLEKDEKLLINLPDFATREVVERVANEIHNAMKDNDKKVIVTAGCEIFVAKPETKIVVEKSKLVETLRKL